MEPFLAINKKYYGTGLRSVDLHIIAFIDNFQRNNKPCYITNQWISEQIGEAESMVKRSLEKLENFNVIKRHTVFCSGNGRNNRHRLLALNDIKEWKLPQKTTQKTTLLDEWMAHSEPLIEENREENREWSAHNEPLIMSSPKKNTEKNEEWMAHNDQSIEWSAHSEPLKLEWMAHSEPLIDKWTAHNEPIKEEEVSLLKEKGGLFDPANAVSQSPATANADPPAAQPLHNFSFNDKLIIRMKLKSGIKKSEVIKDLKNNDNINLTIKELDQIWDEYKGSDGLRKLKELADKEEADLKSQQKQDKALQRKLTHLDELMSALDDRGVMATDDEVIAK